MASCIDSHSTGGKGQRIGVLKYEVESKEGKVGATQRIVKIFKTCHGSFLLSCVNDKREGCNGHHLIEHVEGNKVSCEIKANENAQNHQVKTLVSPLIVFMFHIFEGEDSRQ